MEKFFKLFGSRIMKTGIAVFITATLCHLLNLSAIFAVVTAIVTIEPTASDSIKKGMIRLPASAIGAAFAMTFAGFLGDVALAYALSTVCTIILCHKLKLDDGILVATLTAVMMIPFTTDHFLMSFLARLGTTSIGLFVSTLVNLFILPPNYSSVITKNIHSLYDETSTLFIKKVDNLLHGSSQQILTKQLNDIERKVAKTLKLCHYTREEWKYHRHTTKQMRFYHYELKKLSILQHVLYHLQNLFYLTNKNLDLSTKEKDTLLRTVRSLCNILRDSSHHVPSEHYMLIKEVDSKFWELKEDIRNTFNKYQHHFTTETVLMYEILSIHDILEELDHLCKIESKHIRGTE